MLVEDPSCTEGVGQKPGLLGLEATIVSLMVVVRYLGYERIDLSPVRIVVNR